MGKKLMCLWLLGLSGCGSDGSATPGKDFTCAQSERTGNYTAHAAERAGGTCGALPTETVWLSNGQPEASGATCAPVEPVIYADGDCKIESDVVCNSPDGSRAETVMTIVQTDITGDSFSGMMRAHAVSAGGECSSVYDVTYTRQ